MSFLFRAGRRVDRRKIMKSANNLYAKLKDLDTKLNELETSVSELVILIQKKKTLALFSEYFDFKEGSAPVILIATKDLNAKHRNKLNAFQKKHGFTLIVEKNKKMTFSRFPFLLSHIYEKLRNETLWIVILKPLDDAIFIEDVPHAVFSYPYPTKNAKYQRENILRLMTKIKQNVYVAENDLIGFDNLFYHTIKFFNKKNFNNVIPLVVGINNEISLDELEIIIKEITNWGQNNV